MTKKNLKMTQKHEEDIKNEDVQIEYNKIANDFIVCNQTIDQEADFLIEGWYKLFNYPYGNALTRFDQIEKARIKNEMVACEVLATSEHKENDSYMNQWRLNREKRWLSIFPNGENFTGNKKGQFFFLKRERKFFKFRKKGM